MKKLSNEGFALAEMLVTTVFVMLIFGIIYTHFYPLMAEYEKREAYDDLDGKYIAYWMKTFIEEDASYTIKSGGTCSITNGKCDFTCSQLSTAALQNKCTTVASEADVEKMYITKYKWDDTFKDGLDKNTDAQLIEYLEVLSKPTSSESKFNAQYRIFIKMKRKIISENYDDGNGENEYYAFSTIEVDKWED